MSHAPAEAQHREETKSTVLIASEEVLATWSSNAATPTDLLALTDADAQYALAVIERRRPEIVVLEQIFAASSRGAALINHLRTNADLAGVDIRVLPAGRSAGLGVSGPIAGRVIASMAQPLQQGPIRRATRVPMPAGAETRVNGARAALINVSTVGIQVVSSMLLKPNQKVEVVIDRDGVVVRAHAHIAWSKLELAQNALAYRAGVAFADTQAEVVRLDSTGTRQPPHRR